VPWWIVVMLLWGTAVWSVQENGESSTDNMIENQVVDDDSFEVQPREEKTLMEKLQERLRAVEERERELQHREERVTALQRDMEALAARQAKEAERLKLRASALEEEQRRFLAQDPALDHLIKIYESMDSEEAALRIEQMKEELALDILAAIKGKKAGAILSGVNPSKGARLSEGLRRHREAKLQQRTDVQPKK
jgi:flagellar motility protein MotE (MotC chaperone)